MHNHNTKKTGFVYIMTNKTKSVLYIGVTSDLIGRVWQHRNGEGSDFTKRYNLEHLFYYEEYEEMYKAIEREKQLKNWNRDWKLDLVRKVNPELRDISNEL